MEREDDRHADRENSARPEEKMAQGTACCENREQVPKHITLV
jgi:hypothetical protein